MQQRVSLEIKVGAFVVGGIVLLVFFLFAIGDIASYFQPAHVIRVVFDTANGIGSGSPVQYAGIELGKIQDVRLVYPADQTTPKVELVVRIPRQVQVRADDKASISTFGLLGEKYLAIAPGPGKGEFLRSKEDVLIGQPPVSTEQIIERSNAVLSEFKQTLEGLNSLVGDPESRIYLKEAVQEARDATRNWRLLGERMNLAMSYAESGQGNVGKLMYDEDLYHRMSAFVDDLRAHPWKLMVRPKNEQSAK